MADRPPRLVRFISAELEQLDDGGCRARVELLHQSGESFAGVVEGGGGETDRLLSAARAAADAVRRAVGGPGDKLDVSGVTITEAFGKRTAFVQVHALYHGQRRELLGFCLIDPDPSRAAALAVLNAVNRFFNIG
jgi:hypothetical protein